MSKFKVGDRVEIVSEDDDLGGRPRQTVGCRGVIKLASKWLCEVLLDGEPMGDDYPQSMTWAYDNKDIQLIGREVNNDRRDETTLTRRDYFAMSAMAGILGGGEVEYYPNLAEQCYKIASEMEAARNKEGAE